jgi:hypothetical protein
VEGVEVPPAAGFSCAALILIILVPARPSQMKAMSMPCIRRRAASDTVEHVKAVLRTIPGFGQGQPAASYPYDKFEKQPQGKVQI